MRKRSSQQVSSIASLRRRLLRLDTALVSDALGKAGAMDHDLKCWSAAPRLAGPAMTLRVHTADLLMVGQALSQCPRDYVLVIDGQGELNTALWGALTTESARRRGLAGVVIDGAIRDVARIRRSRFPVFARAAVPNAGGAEYKGETNVPVQCGGVALRPLDWVVGDEDGIVVIPAGRVHAVLQTAERLRELEKRIEREVRRGRALASLLRYDEVLEQKARDVFLPQMRFRER